jgi:hypothetical protein
MTETATAEATETALASVSVSDTALERDRDATTGRFLQGNSGNPLGRPVGAKSKLTEDFLTDFHDCWQKHGKAALAKVALDEPVQFVRAAVQLMPRDVLLEARGAGLIVVKMSDEDLAL